MHLKDLVSLHEAQPDRLPDGRLHLPKLNSLYLRLQELAALQRQHPPCSASEDLLHLLTVSRPAQGAGCAGTEPAGCRDLGSWVWGDLHPCRAHSTDCETEAHKVKSLVCCPTAVKPRFEPKQASLRTCVLTYVNHHTTSSHWECGVLAVCYL